MITMDPRKDYNKQKMKKKEEEKTSMYETCQSCDRVHLGHLKKKHLKKRKKKNSHKQTHKRTDSTSYRTACRS